MTRAKYNKKASQCKRRQKNVSKKKNRILQASGKENVPVSVALNGADEATGTTSTITREEDRRDSQESSQMSRKKQSLEQVAPIRSKSLAASSRRTPNQVLKAQEERNRIEEVRKVAYEWALRKINDEENTESAEQVAREASLRFNVQVLGNTLRTMRRKGSSGYIGPGRKPCIADGDMDLISDGIIMWLTISMMNGEPEKKNSNMEATLAQLLRNSKHHDASPKWLWEKLKRKNAAFIMLSNEERVELRRVQWTTYKNLHDWFLAFKKFTLQYGYATMV